MNSSKQFYLGIAGGMLFLFLAFSMTFIIIGMNKDQALFDNLAITISLVSSLLILFAGFSISLYLGLRKPQIS